MHEQPKFKLISYWIEAIKQNNTQNKIEFDVSTGNNFSSENADLRSCSRTKRVIERDGEAMVTKPEVRYRVPASCNVFGRRFSG